MLPRDWDHIYSDVPVHITLTSFADSATLPGMSQPQRSSSTDSSSESIRKRVCKACDRCRLKKSKCDGANPCSRCKADNAICVFGERKKSHDKVYPKGYVEMLEQQQSQLVSGLQEMYRQLLVSRQWSGPALSETAGHPLTHDILAALDLLESKHDGSGDILAFEEDCQKLQARLFQSGAPCMRRKGSFSSESDRSQHGNGISTRYGTPSSVKPPIFKDSFSFSPSPSPHVQSPAPRKRQTYPSVQQSPLHKSGQLANDPELYHREWSTLTNMAHSEAIMPPKFAMEAPSLQNNLDNVTGMLNSGEWMEPPIRFDSGVSGLAAYPLQFSYPFDIEFGPNAENMEIDFNRWIQVGP